MPNLTTPASKLLLDEIDSYQDTVLFMLGLIHELSWDDARKQLHDDAIHEHGSPQVPASEGDPVTPDIALLLGKAVGIIGEAKVGFAIGPEARQRIRDQILQYDRVARSWRGENGASRRVAEAGVVLLTHATRKVEASDYLSEERTNGSFSPICPFAIVAGLRSSQRQEYITLERSYGRVVPEHKDEKLRKVVSIPLEFVRQRYGSIRFYDAEPPLAYLMLIIWDFIVPPLVPEEGFSAQPLGGPVQSGRGPILIEVTAEEVARTLRDYFSMKVLNSSLPESPRKSLVVSALEQFVRLKLAKGLGGGKYRIEYRKLRQGTLAYLVQKLIPSTPKGRAAGVAKEQLRLFPDDVLP